MHPTHSKSQNKPKIDSRPVTNPSFAAMAPSSSKQPSKLPVATTKLCDTRDPYDVIKQKATADAINETKRMLSNGIYCEFNIFLLIFLPFSFYSSQSYSISIHVQSENVANAFHVISREWRMLKLEFILNTDWNVLDRDKRYSHAIQTIAFSIAISREIWDKYTMNGWKLDLLFAIDWIGFDVAQSLCYMHYTATIPFFYLVRVTFMN